VFPVVIRIREQSEEALTARMDAMREWLDHRRIEPSTFRYTFESRGLVFQVDFKLASEAVAFANEFGGRVIPVSPEMKMAG
jgi:hypothetical protein